MLYLDKRVSENLSIWVNFSCVRFALIRGLSFGVMVGKEILRVHLT